MKKEIGYSKSLSFFYKPKTINQEQYVKYLNDHNTKLLFAIGPAGTGKTMLACNQAVKELKSGVIDKIVITRPIVPVEEEELGFLPGNINKKMDPWTRPIFDIFNEFYPKKDLDAMLYNNVIEISPLAFMRGRTFKNAFIIADEMQNSSPNQMLMLTTRIGEGSKMVITGDLKQSDRRMDSGLSDFINKYKKYTNFITRNNIRTDIGIQIIELNSSDIERSQVIKNLLDIYEFKEPVEKIETMSKTNKSTSLQCNSISIRNDDAALIPIDHMMSKNHNSNMIGDFAVELGATFLGK